MVLTRAQRAQSKDGSASATMSARGSKSQAKTTSTTTKVLKDSTLTTAIRNEDTAEPEVKAQRKVSRATAGTTATNSKSRSCKAESTEDQATAPKLSRTRKQVKFVDETIKTPAADEAVDVSAKPGRGRPRKATAVAPTAIKAAKPTSAPRGRPPKARVAEAEAPSGGTSEAIGGVGLKASTLGKPIRAKKTSQTALPQTAVKITAPTDMPLTSSALAGSEPKLDPPIRASPAKSKTSASIFNQDQAVCLLPYESSSLVMGSPIRPIATPSFVAMGSPIRATPKRLPPLAFTANMQSTPFMASSSANPLFQSPVRHSTKKATIDPFQTTTTMATPSRTIGTPIRRAMNLPMTTLTHPHTTQPKKRSYTESPQQSPHRPASVQAAKRTKLFGTPQRLFISSDLRQQARAYIASECGSAKKTVTFQSPTPTAEAKTPCAASTPVRRAHRMSALTEVTEPEDSVCVDHDPVSVELIVEDIIMERSVQETTAETTEVVMTDLADPDVFMTSPAKQSLPKISEGETQTFTPAAELAFVDIVSKQFFDKSPVKEQQQIVSTADIRSAPVEQRVATTPTSDVGTSKMSVQAEETVQFSEDQESLPLLKSSANLMTNALDLAIATPLPEPLTILSGMSFFVDVWAADGSNANHFFVPLLEELGANVEDIWNAAVTHVLFKDGRIETLKMVVQSGGAVRCLNVGWAVDCERFFQRMPEDGYEIDPFVEGTLTPVARTPLRELVANKIVTPVSRPRTTPSKTPRKTPAKTPAKTPGKTPGTVKFNAAIMAVHNAIQTPDVAREAALDVENLSSSGSLPQTPLLQKTCPPKQSRQSLFTEEGTKSAVKRRLFRGRKSLGDALTR